MSVSHIYIFLTLSNDVSILFQCWRSPFEMEVVPLSSAQMVAGVTHADFFLEVTVESCKVESSWYNRNSPICSVLGCNCPATSPIELVVCYLSEGTC